MLHTEPHIAAKESAPVRIDTQDGCVKNGRNKGYGRSAISFRTS